MFLAGGVIAGLGVGVALAFEPATDVLLVFVVVVLAATLTAGTLMRRGIRTTGTRS